jgi:hypothetical protein
MQYTLYLALIVTASFMTSFLKRGYKDKVDSRRDGVIRRAISAPENQHKKKTPVFRLVF